MKTQPGIERIVESGAKQSIAALIERHRLGHKLLLVCDDNTWLAVGQDIFFTLKETHNIVPYSLGKYAYASLHAADGLRDAAEDVDGLIAVGSGTVNDLTKYVAATRHKPYIAVATAASMNGYVSANASLEHEKLKRSFPARPPIAVLADLDVIVAAPRRLARAGLGDTLCRSTVEADMLLSHLLLDTPYPKAIFDKLRSHEPELLARAAEIRGNEPKLFELLMHALLDAGEAMTEHGSSAVASQGEHMIAHTIEMLYGAELRQVTHGEVIAVTTSSMSTLQQKMLLGTPTVRPLPREKKQFQVLFGAKLGSDLSHDYQSKLLDVEEAEILNQKLQKNWEEYRTQLSAIMMGNVIERCFQLANVPHKPEDIGLNADRYESALTYAHMTRDRFTFLDLAAMSVKRVAL